MPYAEPLAEGEISRRLSELPGWQREGDSITREYRLRYLAGLALIAHVVAIEEAAGHHADIIYTYGGVRFSITTHAAGHKLTARDFGLAAEIEQAAASFTGPLDQP